MTDLARYARQIVLPQVGVNGQQVLGDSSVLLVGCGGLGCAAAAYLAGAGVGIIGLVDGDRVDVSNLQRQILYRQSDVGRPKVEAAAERLTERNPCIEIRPMEQRIDALTLPTVIQDYDVVLDCSDNFPTRFAVNAACVERRKPLISGAAIRQEGQLAVFDLSRGGPCYACLYGQMDGASAERCEDAGVLGPVVGVMGALQALSAIQWLLGMPAGAERLQIWNAESGEWRRLAIPADPKCKVCGSHDND